MAKGFNLTATINLQGPSNIKQVVNNINKQLGSINANVNLNISAKAAQSIANVNKNLQTLNQTLGATTQSATTATQAFNNLAAAMASVGKVNLPTNIAAPVNNITSSVTSASKALGQTRTEFEDFGRQAGLAVRRFAAFSTVTSVIYSFSNAMSKGIQQYIEFDKQITRLSQVTNESKASLGSLVGEITRLSTGLGVASEDLATVSVTLAQAGFSAQDTRRALEALAKSALAPSFDNLNQTVEGSIALMRQFGISAIELEGALGSVNAVAAAFAVEASDIIAAIQRTGGVFASASKGVSEGTDALNEFIAVFTSIRATTRESAETIATGLRTIFTRIQRADTVEALKEYGVVLTDLEGKFVGPYEAVRRLSEGLSGLDPRNLKFSQIIEELGGFRQIGKVLPLIQQFAVAQDALKVAQAGQGSLATDAAKGQLALAVQIQQVREEFSALVRSIGDGKGFQTLVRLGLDLAGALIKIADATKGVLPLIGIMAAFRGVSAVTQFAGGFGGGLTGGKKKAQGGFIHRFADGGSVPGSGNRDSVPAMLTPGEFVMNKKAVQKYGTGNLVRMNRYAPGGKVKTDSFKIQKLENSKIESYLKSNKNKESTLEFDDSVKATINDVDIGKPLNDKEIKKIYATYSLDNTPILKNMYKQAGSRSSLFMVRNGKPAEKERAIQNLQNSFKKTTKKQILEYATTTGASEKAWGEGYEKVILDRFKGVSPGSDDRNYPVDTVEILKNNNKRFGEIKFKTSREKDAKLVQKLLTKRLFDGQQSKYFTENKKNDYDKNKNLGIIDYFFSGNDSSGLNQKEDFYKKMSYGGRIQKFLKGGTVEETAELENMSLQNAILAQIKELGGIVGVKKLVGASGGDRTLDSLLRSETIKQKEAIDPKALKAVNNALGNEEGKKIRRAQTINKSQKLAVVGLQPFDKSEEVPFNIPGFENSTIFVRGLSSRYADAVAGMRQMVENTIEKFGTDIQNTMIFGGNAPLAIDFDETLVGGADIFGPDGKPDIPAYSDLNKVAEGLSRGSLTPLGEKIKEITGFDPSFLDRIRVLTARPQNNAKLLSQRLNQLGIPLGADKITGVSGGNKGTAMGITERLIDDNIKNINDAKKAGKSAVQYAELRKLSEEEKAATGNANAEGAILEATLAKLGAVGGNVQNRAIDFPNGLGMSAAQAFPGISPDWPTEVKRTLSSDNVGRAKEEFTRYYTENYGPWPQQEDAFGFDKSGKPVSRFQFGGRVKFAEGGAPKLIQRGGFKYNLEDIIKAGFTEEQFMKQIPVPGGYGDQWQVGGFGEGSIPMPPSLQPYKAPPSAIQDKFSGAQMAREDRIADALKKDGRTVRDYEGRTRDEKEWRKNRGYSIGGLIQKFPIGGRVSRKVPNDKVEGDPFAKTVSSNKLGSSAYDLEKGSGLSPVEFEQAYQYAKTAQFNIEEFKKDLARRVEDKKQRSQIKINPSDMAQQLMPEAKKSTPKQIALGKTLQDTSNDIGYRPSALETIAQARNDIKNVRGLAGGGAVSLYHGSNTGTNDNVLKSFKEKGALPDIAKGYGQGAGFYVYSGKEKAKQQAMMRVGKGLGSFTVVSGDTEGKPMVVSFKESPEPATWDLDYELNKGPIVEWLVKNYDQLKDKLAPTENLTGIKNVVKEDKSKGIMSSGIRVQEGDQKMVSDTGEEMIVKGGARKTLYSGIESDLREGQLVGQIMARLQAQDPKMVGDFENTFFKSPTLASGEWDNLALKYVGSSPLKPTNIETFADGGSVPALVSNGEAYVPPTVAKRIGYGNLKRMNQADRNGMGRFSSGGISVFKGAGTGTSDSIPANLPVGSFIIREKATKALGFSNGGLAGARVQRFAFGGGPRGPAARPDTISLDTIGATDQAVTALQNVAAALTALGVSSSKSAQLLNRGYQATAAEATRAYEADLLMAKAAGASADILYDLETALAKTKKQAEAEVAIRKDLGNVGGADLQNALTDIEDRIKSLTDTARAGAQSRGLSDEDVEKEVRAGASSRRNQAYEEVASSKGTDLAALGASGEDLERVINNLMRDSKTLEQMNRQYAVNRRAALEQEAAAARAAGNRAMTEKEMEQTIKDEIQARKNAIQEVADTNKSRGPNDREKMDRQNSMLLSFGVMTVGNIIANNISTKSDMTSAGISGAVRGGTEAFSMTNQVKNELDNFAGMLTSAGGRAAKFGNLLSKGLKFAPAIQAIAVFGQAAIDAHNAMRQFTIDLQKSKIERALDGLGDKFEKLNKDLNQLNLRNEIKTNLIDASRSADKLRSATIDTATVGWVNAIDVLVTSLTDSGDGRLKRQSALKSQVLEKDGIMEYLRINSGDTDAYNRASTKYSGEQASESSASFKPIADGINQLIQARARAGETAESMTSAPEFKDFAKSLVYADVALNKQIRQIELSTRYTEDEKKARIEEIISIEGANKIRMQAAIGQREAEQKSIGILTSVYTRSLKRMFTNMEQAINASAFSLKQMSDSIDLATAAITGQAKVGNIDLETSNVIQNPRAYSGGQVASAQASAGSLFGSKGPEMSKLMNLGETVESTVMSTINKTLENKGVDVSNESIASAVDQSVRVELKGLGLPPELADKLAKEVGSTLVDLRSSGDNKVDFAKLSERLGSLNSVIDTAKDAQQAAIKALENYQNILNQYANNINKIIDLESSSRERSRKAIQISSDANLELAKSLGKTIKLSDAFAKRDASVSRQTGGLTAPDDIFQKILKLNTDRQVQQSSAKQAAEKGPAGVQDFVKFNSELSQTNLALRENRAALEEMANNTDKASAAMSAIQEAQQKAAGRVGFLEKVVTSTPEELESLNQSLYRLQRNMNGQQNTIQGSIGAQKAYRTSLEQGASAAEAMRAAQAAFSNERKETVGALQDILPFLGDSQQAGNVKANVLESMLQESGMGVSPLFQQVLNTLRNPDQDPATAAAMQYYQQAIGEQSRATALLGQLDTNLAQDIARLNSKLIVEGLKQATLTFENAELKDIANKVNTIVNIIGRGVGAPPAGAGAPPAVGIATGGLVYASAGQLINFQPQGTDTVPAMLTPGEFVVNRKSTQANLPLLRSINNNKYSSGGSVGYYAGGGLITNWGKPDTIKNFDEISKKEIIDTSPGPGGKNSSLITEGYKKFTKIPPLYTLKFPSRSKSLPVGNSDPYSLDNIDLNSAEVIFGVTPGIDLYDKKNYVSNFSEDLLSEFESPTIIKDDKTLYLGKEKFGATKVSKLQEAEIREQLDKINVKSTRLANFNPDAFSDGTDQPKISDFTAPTKERFIPNLKQPKSPGISTDGLDPFITSVDETTPNYKPWLYNRSLYNPAYGYRTMAASVSPPEFRTGSPLGKDKYASKDFKMTQTGDFGRYTKDPRPGMIPGKKIKEQAQTNEENKQIYLDTLDFIAGGDVYEKNGKGTALQDRLRSLFDNQASFITLTKPDLLPFDELKDAETAIIGQQSLDNSFRKASEVNRGAGSKIKFGLIGAPPAGALPDSLLSKPFTITDEGVPPAPPASKSYPFMINGDIKELGKDFENKAREELAKRTGKVSSKLITDNLKLTLPFDLNGSKPTIDLPISYEEYTGELYDVATSKFDGNPFNTFLPNKIDETLFQKLDTSSHRLFTPAKYTAADILSKSSLNDPAIQTQLADLIKMRTNNDPNVAAQTAKVSANLELLFNHPQNSLIKYPSIPGSADVFSGKSDEPTKVNIGEFVLGKLEEFQSKVASGASKVAQVPGLKKGATFSNADLPVATSALIRGATGLFGNLKLPGFPSGWLVKSGSARALRAAVSGNPAGAAGHMSGIFNQAGAFISQLQNRATTVPAYNALDNASTLIGGAANAFASLAGGDTSLLKQFYEQKIQIADVFRSFGTSAKFGKVAGLKLTPDWQNILGSQLSGTKIKTVGRDGSLTESDLAGAIPENANVNDLIKVLFNPYNEFPNKSARSDLIQKFGNDLFNLRGQNRMPYFDPKTLSWIGDGLTRLKKWYGGEGNWLGQDYFFDTAAEPDNAARMSNFLSSLTNDGQQYYKSAQEAQVLFGLANSFGPLPGADWFTARAAVPQKKATGGIIYAQDGGGPFINFAPQGTDTVPAMLTPGEFVVNRSATQKNLPLLKAMNSGGSVGGYSRGGVVYLAGGSDDPIQTTVSGGPVGNIEGTDVKGSVDEEIRRATAEKIEQAEKAKSINYKYGEYTVQRALSDTTAFPTEGYGLSSIRDYLGVIQDALKTKNYAGLTKLDTLPNQNINVDDLTQHLSTDPVTQEAINPYLADSTPWLWKFNMFSPDIASESRKTDESKEIQPDIRHLSPRLDAWSEVIQERLDTNKQKQKLAELEAYRVKMNSSGGRGTSPAKQIASQRVGEFKSKMTEWESKSGEYKKRLSSLQSLISLRKIGGGTVKANEVAAMEAGESQEYNDARTLGLREDIIDEGVAEGTRKGLRNLVIGLAVGAAAPFFAPALAGAGIGAGLGTLLIGGAAGIGAIMGADAREAAQYEELKTLDPEEFARQQLLRNEGSYQAAQASTETLVDVADLVLSLGAGAATSQLAKKSRFFKFLDSGAETAGKKIFSRPSAASAKTQKFVEEAKRALNESNQTVVGKFPPEDISPKSAAAATSDATTTPAVKSDDVTATTDVKPDDITPTVKPPKPDDIAPTPTVKSPDDAPSSATKMDPESSTTIKLPKAMRLLVEEKLASFKAMVQEAQANRISQYVDQVEKEASFRIQSMEEMIADNWPNNTAYNEAVANGVTDKGILTDLMYAPYRDDLAKLSDDLGMKGWDVDLGPPLSANRNDDIISQIIEKDMLGDDAWRQTRDAALNNADNGLSKEGSAALRKAADDPNIKFENRSWLDWSKQKTKGVLEGRNKYIVGAGLVGLAALMWPKNQPEGKPKEQPTDLAPTEDLVPGQPANGGVPVVDAPQVPLPPMVDAAANAAATKPQTVPNYYDELTYKEYLSRELAAGNPPPAPDKKLFTTAAFYAKNKEGSFRQTAYDRRASNIPQQVGDDKDPTKKSSIGGRNQESQMHTTTAAFAGAPMDVRDVTEDNKQAAISSGGFSSTGQFGTNQNTKEGNSRIKDSIIPPQTQLQEAYGAEPMEGEDPLAAENRAQEHAAKKITGRKGIESQYKSAYSFYRRKLGEYTYYNSVNYQNKDKFAQGKMKNRTETVARTLSSGGVVYASNGTLIPYSPRGTDTVPAMLTPGEFVVNARSAQKNLPLLHSINANKYAAGGRVSYLAGGTQETPEEKAARLQKIRDTKLAQRKTDLETKRAVETKRKAALQKQLDDRGTAIETARTSAIAQRAAPAEQRKKAMEMSREKGISPQQAMATMNTERRAAPESAGGGFVTGNATVGGGATIRTASPQQQGVPQISPQTQQRVGMAAQAAFDPKNSGDMNKQLVIFGTLLTGVNQVITQFGAVMQQLVAGAGQGGGVINKGEPPPSTDGISQFTTSLNNFVNQLQKLNIPPEIKISISQTKPIDVNINGADALQALLAGPLGAMITQTIGAVFNKKDVDNEKIPGS